MEFLKTKKLIEMMVASKIVPGVNYLIFKNNNVWQNTVGLSQIIPQPVPLKADAIYDLASLTKVIGTTTLSELYKIKTPAKLHARSWGWDLCFDPSDHHTLIYHTGFTGTFMLLDKVKKTGLIVLTNRIYPSGHNLIFLKMRQKIIESFLLENSII